jgi:hypothetical protein
LNTFIHCHFVGTQLRNDAHFNGDSYLEFDRNLLDHIKENGDELIAVELSTNSSNGLIFWHGQTPSEDGQGKDFISLGGSSGHGTFQKSSTTNKMF